MVFGVVRLNSMSCYVPLFLCCTLQWFAVVLDLAFISCLVKMHKTQTPLGGPKEIVVSSSDALFCWNRTHDFNRTPVKFHAHNACA